MSLAHLTLPTLAVERTARFLEQTLGYTRDPAPANSPVETVWLAAGGGQQMHIIHVEGFEVSPFEGEFGRHIAIFRPAQPACLPFMMAKMAAAPPSTATQRRPNRASMLELSPSEREPVGLPFSS